MSELNSLNFKKSLQGIYIGVTGPISIGKSTLVKDFRDKLGFFAMFEPVPEDEGNIFFNKHLPMFYGLIKKYESYRDDLLSDNVKLEHDGSVLELKGDEEVIFNGEQVRINSDYAKDPALTQMNISLFLKKIMKDVTLGKLHHKAYSMETFLMAVRYLLHQQAAFRSITENIIQDRVIWEDHIFVDMLHKKGYITDEDYETYCVFFSALTWTCSYPHIIVYLRGTAETCHRRWKIRNRDKEDLTLEYLASLVSEYDFFLNDMKKRCCVVDIDYNEDNLGLDHVLSEIKKQAPQQIDFINSLNRKALSRI